MVAAGGEPGWGGGGGRLGGGAETEERKEGEDPDAEPDCVEFSILWLEKGRSRKGPCGTEGALWAGRKQAPHRPCARGVDVSSSSAKPVLKI